MVHKSVMSITAGRSKPTVKVVAVIINSVVVIHSGGNDAYGKIVEAVGNSYSRNI